MTEKELKECVVTRDDFAKLASYMVLSKRQRKIFYLTYFHEMPQAEIAEEVKCCRKTVSKEIQEIRRRFSKIDLLDVIKQ